MKRSGTPPPPGDPHPTPLTKRRSDYLIRPRRKSLSAHHAEAQGDEAREGEVLYLESFREIRATLDFTRHIPSFPVFISHLFMNFLRYSFFGIALLILLTGCSRLTVLEGNNAIVYQDKERICRNVSDTMRDDFLLYRQKDIPVIQYFLLCYPTSRQSSDSPIQIAPIGS